MLCVAESPGCGFGPCCVPDDCGAALDFPAVACCCQTAPPAAVPRVTPLLATAAPTEVPRTAKSITTARMLATFRRSLNDTSPCRRRNYRTLGGHAYPSRYHRGRTHRKPLHGEFSPHADRITRH